MQATSPKLLVDNVTQFRRKPSTAVRKRTELQLAGHQLAQAWLSDRRPATDEVALELVAAHLCRGADVHDLVEQANAVILGENEQSIFERKAISDLALALLDWDTDRGSLPERAEAVAQIASCTPAQLFAYMHVHLCSLMGLPRVSDFFGHPTLDIEFAKASNRECLPYWRTHRTTFS